MCQPVTVKGEKGQMVLLLLPRTGERFVPGSHNMGSKTKEYGINQKNSERPLMTLHFIFILKLHLVCVYRYMCECVCGSQRTT